MDQIILKKEWEEIYGPNNSLKKRVGWKSMDQIILKKRVGWKSMDQIILKKRVGGKSMDQIIL